VAAIVLFELSVIKHKLKAIIHISFFMLCIYIIALLKQVYQQSRPIWSSSLIHKFEWFCPKDFGNPSGHSFAIFPLYEPLISKYVGFDTYGLSWTLLVIFGFCVPFSRTYLGVHSVNQILFGLTLGITATLMYRYGIRLALYKVFARIYKQKLNGYLVGILLLHVICYLLPFLFFEMYSDRKPMDSEDV
jgi:membrane-associated phospholipid phosphatase